VINKAGLQCVDLRISQDLEYWGYIATFGLWGFIPKVLWVGNSASVATESGWTEKYKMRRRLCPDVETWEKRIIPRLTPTQLDGFRIVRGRVAASFAHNKILGGDTKAGFEILRKYYPDMPKNRVVQLLNWGDKLGFCGRNLSAIMLKVRELAKG
jgi:hypothetical protein